MTCKIVDYNKVLDDQLIFNSPFYDGVIDINVVDDILGFAGFRDGDKDDPAYLIKQMADQVGADPHQAIGLDGRVSKANNYALPENYDKLQGGAFFRFNDGTKFSEMISNIVTRAGKVFYFDTHGQARMESYLDFHAIDYLFKQSGPNASNVLYEFTTNPDYFEGQLIFNAVSVTESVEDVFNHVKILTSTPEQALIYADDVDVEGLTNPSHEGFIGYLKTVYQSDGIFSSMEATRNMMNQYLAFRRPPYIVNFETYGLPVRALDIIKLNDQPLRVTKVDTTIDPSKNEWWQSYECEWFQPVSVETDPATSQT
jgi:hypothetical protein